MRSGAPPKTTAAAGSSHGRYGEPERETTATSARLPGTSEPISRVEPQRPSAAERRELERLGCGERAGALGAGAGQRDHRAQLLEEVVRRDRGDAVGADADAEAGGAKRLERRDAAAEQGVRARAVRDRDAVRAASSPISSSSTLTQCAATTRSSSSPAPARRRIPLCPSGSTSSSRDRLPRPLAAQQPVELVLALVQVRRDRQAEAGAGGVHLGRARVRRVRRDAELHPVRERPARRTRASPRTAAARRRARCRRPRGRRSPAGRARRRRARSRPRRRGRRPCLIPERRHSAAPSRAIASMSARSSRRFRSMWSESHGPNESPSPKPA